MATEIELKAHVQDVDSLKRLLPEKAEYKFAFEKEDLYFFPGLRLRSEKRILPDGSEEFETLLTRKQKKVMDGVEQNEEMEFEIRPSSCQAVRETASDFGGLLEEIGLQPLRSKQKRGWSFFQDGITAELLEVENLGWFLELEILTANSPVSDGTETGSTEGKFAEERQRLLTFLDSVGLPREAIESRFYSEMLTDKASQEKE